MNETGRFECLGQSNWIICIPLSPFCPGNVQFVSSLYWKANSYCPTGLIVRKGKSPNSKNEWDRGVSVPGAFKLDHFNAQKPILFINIFQIFSLSFPLANSSFLVLPKSCKGVTVEKGVYRVYRRTLVYPNSRNGWETLNPVPGAYKIYHVHDKMPSFLLSWNAWNVKSLKIPAFQ